LSAIFHEFGHALCGQNCGVTMKRSGIFLLFIFPGAFVSLDNEMLKLKSDFSQVMIICAGPFHNIVLGVLSFKLIANLPIMLSWGYFHSRTDGTGLMILKSNAKGLILTELNDQHVIGNLPTILELPSPSRCVKPVMVFDRCCQSELIMKENLNCIWDLPSVQTYTSSLELQLSNVTPRYCTLFNSDIFYESQKCTDNECEDPDLQCMTYFGDLLYLKATSRFNNSETHTISFIGNKFEFQDAFLISEFTPKYKFLPISLPFLIEIFSRYMYSLNLVLGLVNMFPAFQFDGKIAFSIIFGALGLRDKRLGSLWLKFTTVIMVVTVLFFAASI
jgi:S2P endopeptidase